MTPSLRLNWLTLLLNVEDESMMVHDEEVKVEVQSFDEEL